MPALPVGDDVQQPLCGWHVVGVAGGDGLPLVAVRVGAGDAEGLQEPVPAVGAVVGQRLARPFAGDQDAAPGVAEVLAAVGFAGAPARAHALAGVLGLDAVAQPVRAGRRARLVPERVDQALRVRVLCVGVGLVAVADVLGQVLGQVPDAPRRVLRLGEDPLGVELRPEPGDVQGRVLGAYRVERVIPGLEELPGCRVEVAARWLVPDGQAAVLESHRIGGGHHTWW